MNDFDPLAAIELYPDDVFLVSYPRSGNTWTRFLIANYLSGSPCDFQRCDRIVPDIYQTPAAMIQQLNRPRILKSHQPFTPRYQRVIYLVRDGRDVAVSYYYYHLKYQLIPENTSFAEFLQAFNAGSLDRFAGDAPLFWSRHVNGWLDHLPPDHLLIRYEDLRSNTADEFKRILNFLDVPIHSDQLIAAVAASDFKTMQQVEQPTPTVPTQSIDQSIRFIRAGKVGGWQEYFTEELIDRFIQVHGSALTRLHYMPASIVGAIARHHTQIQHLELQVAALKAQTKDLRQKLKKSRQAVQHAKQQMRTMEASKFWWLRTQWIKVKNRILS